MNDIKHYTYRLHYSDEDDGYIATVAEFPSLSWIADTELAALKGLQDMLQEVLDDMRAHGERIPQAIGERSYSGRFMVRIPPIAHERLALQAAEEGVSLNRLVSMRLVDA